MLDCVELFVKRGLLMKRFVCSLAIFTGLLAVAPAQEVDVYPQLGHNSTVNSVAFSPDGKQVLSNSGLGLKLWDINTGRLIRTFSGHGNLVNSVAFSPDGKQVLSGSSDSTVRLWDVASGSEIRTFRGHSIGKGVTSVAFSPDGKQVLSGSSDSTVRLWDVASGSEIRTFRGHSIGSVHHNPYGVTSVAFSPDGRQIVSGSYDFTVKLWDVATGQEIKTFSGHTRGVTSVAFSPDGKQIISGSNDNTVKLWDATTGKEIRTFAGRAGSGSVNSVAFSPDGRQIISGSDYGNIKLWDVTTGSEIKNFSTNSDYISSVCFSPDGSHIISGSKDKIVKLFDVATGREIRVFEGHTHYLIIPVAFSPEGTWIISGSRDRTIKLWDVATGREIKTFLGHIDDVDSVAFSPDGRRIISASKDGTTRIWDIAIGKEIASFISFTDGEWIVITPDGYYNSSPKGDQYLNVRIENNVYGMDQFAKTFYRPDVVERRLQGLPDPVGFQPEVRIQTASVPPDLRVTAGEVDPVTRQVVFSITATDDIRRISDVQIIINGRLVGGEELMNISAVNLEARNTRLVASSEDRQYVFTVTLQLDPGLNRIEIVAANDFNYGLGLLTIGVPQAEAPPKGDLWLLAIGVDDYAENPAYMDLQYAVSDAHRIIDAFKAQEGDGKRYDNVHTLKITDGEATKQNILYNISNFFSKAGRNDVVALYVASHGKTENGVYCFFPSDTVFTKDGEFVADSVINIDELTRVLDIPGRKIVMLDTCESGGVDTNRLVHTLRNRSTVIFTASQKDEKALEGGIFYDGGFFTIGMTEGLSGRAAKNGVVRISTLEEYVVDRVSRMSIRRQRPASLVPDSYKEFVISVVE
jgi:WD40 repeat protein